MKQKYIHPQTEIVKLLIESFMDTATGGGHFGNAKEGFFDEVSNDNDFWTGDQQPTIWED